jgi:hypothetical protein
MFEARNLDKFGIDTTNNAYRGAGCKKCQYCEKEFHSYQSPAKFCSIKCRSKSKELAQKHCKMCGKLFKPETVARKFCGRACASASQKKAKSKKNARTPHIVQCYGCMIEFRSSPSQKRKYCSYSCHIKHGGAQRAGDAAAMAKLKYGAKKDANHNVIFDMIRKFTAAYDLSNSGCGVPDGIAWCAGGWQLFDVKNPNTRYGKRGLNDRQKRWANDWRGGPVYLIYTIEQAEQFAKGNLQGLPKFPSE